MSAKVNLTEAAIKAAKTQIEKRAIPNTYIRIGVKGSGCNGHQYVLQFDDKPTKDTDLTFEFGDVKVVVDDRSIKFLDGTTIDYKKSLKEEGFSFNNPLVKNECGCGRSFST